MSEKPDIQKSLEAIAGYELPDDAVQIVDFFLKESSYSSDPQGFTTKTHVFLPHKSCEQTHLLDVGGVGMTNLDGKRLFRLTNTFCRDPSDPTALIFLGPICVVATPRSSNPCILTISRSLLSNGTDVEIQVSTWDANGAVAPRVSFDWRCRVGLVFGPV